MGGVTEVGAWHRPDVTLRPRICIPNLPPVDMLILWLRNAVKKSIAFYD